MKIFSILSLVFLSFAGVSQTTISGEVRLKSNNQKISNYTIILEQLGKFVDSSLVISKLGKFEFTLNDQERYKLVAKKDGFLDEVVIVQAKRDTEKTYYEITIGNDTATYLVEGVIMNRENGQPIAGASVKLINKMIHFVTEATTDSLGKYVYRLRKGYDYYVLAKKNGFLLNTGKIDYCENKKDKHGIYCLSIFSDVDYLSKETTAEPYLETVLKLDPIDLKKTYRIDNIYYDLNKWNIRPDAATELNKLLKVLKDNPEINIELGSHTDSRGSSVFNDTLSRKRAESAVAYIIKKGIDKERMTAKGYGETKPVNKCVDGVKCSEEAHQQNRRTEFRITSFEQWKKD
jgi:outer membrane protein OmpA-like peptidoglycan-associated protein